MICPGQVCPLAPQGGGEQRVSSRSCWESLVRTFLRKILWRDFCSSRRDGEIKGKFLNGSAHEFTAQSLHPTSYSLLLWRIFWIPNFAHFFRNAQIWIPSYEFSIGWISSIPALHGAHHSPLLLLLQLRGLIADSLVGILLCPLLTLGRVQVALQLETHTWYISSYLMFVKQHHCSGNPFWGH